METLNDADAAGIAEMRYGAGRDKSGVVLMLTFGTGIGSALFVDGHLVPNTEFGHIQVDGEDGERRASAAAREREELELPEWAQRVDRYLDVLEAGLWPDLIIVGGGVSKKAHKWVPLLSTRTPVVPAQLQNDAGIVGAALAAHERADAADERARTGERRVTSGARALQCGPLRADAPRRVITHPEHAERLVGARPRGSGTVEYPPTRRYNERAPARRPPAGRDPLPVQRPNAAPVCRDLSLSRTEDRNRCPGTTRSSGGTNPAREGT